MHCTAFADECHSCVHPDSVFDVLSTGHLTLSLRMAEKCGWQCMQGALWHRGGVHHFAGSLAAHVHRGAVDRPRAVRCRRHCPAAY